MERDCSARNNDGNKISLRFTWLSLLAPNARLASGHIFPRPISPIKHTMPRWGNDQRTLLWELYRTNRIDPNNDEKGYVFEKTQQYFPEFVGVDQNGRDYAIRRLRNCNARRRIELELERGGREENSERFSFVRG